MRRTKATLTIGAPRTCGQQLLPGTQSFESTVYLGIEVDDALEISEQTEI